MINRPDERRTGDDEVCSPAAVPIRTSNGFCVLRVVCAAPAMTAWLAYSRIDRLITTRVVNFRGAIACLYSGSVMIFDDFLGELARGGRDTLIYDDLNGRKTVLLGPVHARLLIVYRVFCKGRYS